MTAAAEVPGITGPDKPQGLSAATVLGALQRHYRRPGADRNGEVLIPEAQAPGSNRRADLVRVGVWASRGVGIDVHEIKVSRQGVRVVAEACTEWARRHPQLQPPRRTGRARSRP